ncbi:MAG: glycosyltransferase family 4 protein [Coleofasciculaceae cyanobacterium RL_1_1]|nr:glycosyltransferase family 4 protein [Coleofasciculaceae cyanobacterium RL_1_1]
MVLPINLSFLMDKPTGISTYARHVAHALGDRDDLDPLFLVADRHRDFATYRRFSIPPQLTPEQGVRGHARRLLWTQFSLPRVCRQIQSNVLFSPIPEAPIGSINSQFRYAVTAYDLIPLRFPQKATPLLAYHKFYVPEVLRRADRILAISTATARDLRSFLQIDPKKIEVIPLAYDRQQYYDRRLPRSNYFVYVGRQEPYKNLDRIIQAMAQIPDEIELHILGKVDARYAPALKHRAKLLKLSHRIKFCGYIPEVELPEAIGRAIGLVFPSLWEGFGLPILEAMACGTPVITSNFGSMPEVAGEAALLVDPYNVSMIAAAMRLLWNDSAARSQLQAAGLKRVNAFNWEKTGQLTGDALRFLVDN